jgi:L-threonylcarbamoyladenylate synthase
MSLTLKVDPEFPDDRSLVLAAEVIQSGGIIVYPTETLYGIGAGAFDERAVGRVQALKQRDMGKPILVLVESVEAAFAVMDADLPAVRDLARVFWPGPLTLVSKTKKRFPNAITMGRDTVGIRVPSSPLCLRLLKLCGVPLTSTSANVSGGPVLRSSADIAGVFGSGVDLYLDAGEIPDRPPSTVVDVTGPKVRLIRAGAIPLRDVQEVVEVVEE